MPLATASEAERVSPPLVPTVRRNVRDFPYWLVGIGGVVGWISYLTFTKDRYRTAFDRIIPGLRITAESALFGFLLALLLGLVIGLGRISRNVVLRNIAIFYIELVRGIPILVLIFTIAFVVVPATSDTFGFDISVISQQWRAIIALALIYAAYLAEVFRAGIESIPRGQTEAGRALGMSHGQTMRRIVLPQAVRNMIPAIGNDAIAMVKDTSLLSVLAVRELTQNARQIASTTFDFKATYMILVGVYMLLTVSLSMLLAWYRRRLGLDDRD